MNDRLRSAIKRAVEMLDGLEAAEAKDISDDLVAGLNAYDDEEEAIEREAAALA